MALQACAPHAVIYQLADPEYPQVFEARACNGWHTPDQQARVLMQAWGMTQQNPWFSVVQELERTRTMLGVPAVPPHAAASSQHQQPAAPAPQPARQLGGGQRGGAQQQSSTRGGPRQQGGFAELMRGKLASAPVVPISQGIQPFQAALECIQSGGADDRLCAVLFSSYRWSQQDLLRLLWAAVRHGRATHIARVLDACREMGFSWSFTGEWTTLPDPEGISQPLIFAALEELGKGDAAVLGALEVVDLLLDCNPSLVLSRSDASDSHYLLPVDVALRALGAREVYAPRACNQWFSLDQYAWVLIQGAGLAGDERWSNLFLQLNAFRTGLGIPAAQPGRPAASQQQQQRVHSSWAAPPAAQQPPRQQHAAAPSQQQQGGFAELMRAKLAPPDQRRLEDWQALHDAAQTGSARLLREILPRHTWSEAELRAVAIDAAVVGRSWPAVQEVLRHWGAPGLESLVHTVENGAGSGTEHIVFRLVQDAAENRSKGYVCDIVAILQHFAAACPAILHMRDAAGANHPARATVQHGAPLEVVHALAPYAERATWSAATGPRSRASTPLQLAHQMTRQYSRRSQTPNQAWELYYLSVAKYLAGHDAQYAQEMRQAQEAGIERLREQARALEAAVEAGDVESVRRLVAALEHPDLKDLRHKVFRGSGFKGFLESCLPKAGRLDMVNAFLDAARESGAPDLPPLHKLAPTLLSNALRSGKAELALQIVKELPEAVHSLQRPPLVPTIAAGATVELIEVLIGVLVEVCQKRGGSFADEPEHSEGKLSPVLAAIKYKRSDVLEKLLEHSTRPAIIEVGRVKWTPLAFAIAEEQAIAARRLLRHAHQRLGPPPDKPAADSSRLRKYLDAACDGAPALLRAVESLPDSGLPTALLVAGADPSVYGRGKADKKTTALHAAIRAGDSALARRMLEALAPAKLNVLADSHGLLPLHAAIRSKDVELVKALLNKGANPVPATAGSPLLDALRQHREEPTQATATVRDALLAGWTAQRTLAALGPQLGESDRQLVAAFLASQRSVTLAPFLRDKKARVELLQGAVDELNAPLLELLCEQPGLNTEGVKLHGAVGSPDVAGSGLPVPLIQRLLAAGCRLNQRDGERGALLVHKAVEKANMELLQLLLGLGSEASSIGARDALGHTLMHYASRDAPTNKREDFVRFLFDLRPSLVNVKNARGETPAFYTNHKRTIRLLAELAESINDSLPPEAVDTEAAASSSKRPLQEDDDLSQPGPAVEPEARKRQRIDAMLAKLPAVWEAVQAQAQQAASAAAAQAAPETQLAGGREFSEVVAETVANVLPEGADADAAELAAAAAEAEGAFSGDEADDLEVAAEVARLATANAPVEDLLKPDAAALGVHHHARCFPLMVGHVVPIPQDGPAAPGAHRLGPVGTRQEDQAHHHPSEKPRAVEQQADQGRAHRLRGGSRLERELQGVEGNAADLVHYPGPQALRGGAGQDPGEPPQERHRAGAAEAGSGAGASALPAGGLAGWPAALADKLPGPGRGGRGQGGGRRRRRRRRRSRALPAHLCGRGGVHAAEVLQPVGRPGAGGALRRGGERRGLPFQGFARGAGNHADVPRPAADHHPARALRHWQDDGGGVPHVGAVAGGLAAGAALPPGLPHRQRHAAGPGGQVVRPAARRGRAGRRGRATGRGGAPRVRAACATSPPRPSPSSSARASSSACSTARRRGPSSRAGPTVRSCGTGARATLTPTA